MTITELPSDGRLTRDLIKSVGEEFRLQERAQGKAYGLGHLKYTSGDKTLDEFYEFHHNAVRVHFDWTKGGAIFRLRTVTKQFAFVTRKEDIKEVTLTKRPDRIYAAPLFPFWILLQMNVPFRIARRFMLRPDSVDWGDCEIIFRLNGSNLNFRLEGQMWNDCLMTFNHAPHNIKVKLIDERTWMTENWFEIRS